MELMSPARGSLLCALSLLLSGLCGCKQPVVGQCEQRDGYLCVHVQKDAQLSGSALTYDIEVRLGTECDKLAALETKQTFAQPCAPPPLAQCVVRRSRDETPPPLDGGVPQRFYDQGEFTADIRVADLTGTGVARVALLKDGECAAFDTLTLADQHLGFQEVTAHPTADKCTGWHRPCGDPLTCGGAGRAQAQICCNGICVDPPDPPVRDPGDPKMTFIPAGSMVLGDAQGREAQGEQPCADPAKQRFTITRPFYVDTTEVTVAQYKQCSLPGCSDPVVAGRGCIFLKDAPTNDALAVNCVTHDQAMAYCQFHTGNKGGLLTEAEWEWVAGRDPKARFPWSVDPKAAAPDSAMLCQYGNIASCDNMVHAPGLSPLGNTPSVMKAQVAWPLLPIMDLAGNLSEWVADADNLVLNSRCQLHDQNPSDPVWAPGTGTYWVYKGGNWKSMAYTDLRTFTRDILPQTGSDVKIELLGIRCKLQLPL